MKVEETPCPGCGKKTLRIEQRLVARKIGSYSLSGAQMKVSASQVPYLVCGACGIEAQGRVSHE